MTPVKSSIDSIVVQDGNIIGFATEVTIDEDFQLEAIITLGFHGPRGFKSLGYSCNFTVGTFILNPELPDGTPVTDNLVVATRRNINQQNDVTFELVDLVTNEVYMKVLGAKSASNNWGISAGQLATKNTSWQGREVVLVNVL